MSPAPAPRAMLALFNKINAARSQVGAEPITYDTLGKRARLSKSTAYALLRGAYASANKDQMAQRLHNALLNLAEENGVRTAPSRPSRPSSPSRPSGPSTTRVCTQGYLKHQGRTYYVGSAFFGSVSVSSPARKDHALTVTSPTAGTRTVYPVDASTNQLGYHPGRAAA